MNVYIYIYLSDLSQNIFNKICIDIYIFDEAFYFPILCFCDFLPFPFPTVDPTKKKFNLHTNEHLNWLNDIIDSQFLCSLVTLHWTGRVQKNEQLHTRAHTHTHN